MDTLQSCKAEVRKLVCQGHAALVGLLMNATVFFSADGMFTHLVV
jgi:hypothetical protein